MYEFDICSYQNKKIRQAIVITFQKNDRIFFSIHVHYKNNIQWVYFEKLYTLLWILEKKK